MSRVLVVYYSRTGTTKAVAAELADALSADVEEIVDRTPRAGLRGYVRSAIEAALGKRARLEPPKHEPADYDVVVLGSPVWNGLISSPLKTYLADHSDELLDVAFFCTCRGRGGRRALAQMSRISGKRPTSTLVVRETKLTHGETGHNLARFAGEVRAALESGVAAGTPPL
jgi:flavodoxin